MLPCGDEGANVGIYAYADVTDYGGAGRSSCRVDEMTAVDAESCTVGQYLVEVLGPGAPMPRALVV